jgi:hypothetical protein
MIIVFRSACCTRFACHVLFIRIASLSYIILLRTTTAITRGKTSEAFWQVYIARQSFPWRSGDQAIQRSFLQQLYTEMRIVFETYQSLSYASCSQLAMSCISWSCSLLLPAILLSLSIYHSSNIVFQGQYAHCSREASHM